MVFRLPMIYKVELKTKCNISGVDIQRRVLNTYPFGLDHAINEGASKTRPAFDQKGLPTYISKTLQDLLRLSMRDGLPALLTVVVIRFHGLKDRNEKHITRRKVGSRESHTS